MKLYALAGIDDTQDTFRSTWAYREYFHGDCSFLATKAVCNVYGEKPYKPLRLVRNEELNPPVFVAGVSLIAEQSVAAALGRDTNVDLVDCVWDGVYRLPATRESVLGLVHHFSVMTDDFYEWLRPQVRRKPDRSGRPSYVEILAPRHASLIANYPLDAVLDLPSPAYTTLEPIRTGRRLHEAHPIVEASPYYLISERAFDVLAPHVADSELFMLRTFDV